MDSEIQAAAERNAILNRLSAATRNAVLNKASLVSLPIGRVLWRQDATIQKVYFPVTCVVSTLVSGGAQREIELATVGNDGIVDISAALAGVPRSIGRAVIQVPGQALVMSMGDLGQMLLEEDFSALLHRYVYYCMRLLAQSAVCHRFHTTEERCARWLLLIHDLAGTDEFALTQTFLGAMLSAGRPAVNLALAALRRGGAIEYRYRCIRIVDRHQLESFSCPCYEVLRRSRQALDF